MTIRGVMTDSRHGTTLRSGFLRSAADFASNAALVLDDRVFTYAELDQKARTWAHAILDGLTATGGLNRPPRRVGVFASRGHVAYTGMLAALFSGGVSVPLSHTFPVERTRAMIRMADLDVLLVDRKAAEQLPDVLDGATDRTGVAGPKLIILPDDRVPRRFKPAGRVIGRSTLAGFSPLDELPPIMPNETACLLFTSGSAGRPKGVRITHTNVRHLIDIMSRRYGISPEDRFSQTLDPMSGLSILSLFVAWERGACVCEMPLRDLLAPASFLAKHHVTVMFSVPAIPALMLQKGTLKADVFPTLRRSLFCGEPLPRALAEAWQAAAPNSAVENLYGATELTLACFSHRWDPQTSPAASVNGMVSIGRPHPGVGAVVVDEQLHLVPPGEAGELCVCGPLTAPGYWRDPQKTAERFVWIDVPSQGTGRFFCTGDRVRYLPSGEYVYLGRQDHQVKIRGDRVELGDVELALHCSDNVLSAVALGWPMVDGVAEGIVAFVSGVEVDCEQLQAAVRRQLPEHMVPQTIIHLEQMPLNASGKIDRPALVRSLADPAAILGR